MRPALRNALVTMGRLDEPGAGVGLENMSGGVSVVVVVLAGSEVAWRRAGSDGGGEEKMEVEGWFASGKQRHILSFRADSLA